MTSPEDRVYLRGAKIPRLLVATAISLMALAALGAVAAVLVPYEVVVGWLSAYSSTGNAASSYSAATHHRLTTVMLLGAGALATGAALGFWLRARLAALVAELADEVAGSSRAAVGRMRMWMRSCPSEVAALVMVCMAGLGLRLFYAGIPVKGDETLVWLTMANRPLPIILADYSNVGNHIFHTVLMHLSWLVLGEGHLAMRLPALIAGAVLVPATYAAARIAFGSTVGLLAAVLVAGTSVLVEYSVNSRGYMLQSLLVVLVLAVIQLLLRREAPSRWVALVLLLALAMWTLPTSGIALGGIGCWVIANVVWHDGRAAAGRLLRFALAGLAAAALTLLLYGPALLAVGFDPLVKMMRSGSTDVSQSVIEALWDLWRVWTRSLPAPFSWLALMLLGWGIIRERRHSDNPVPLGAVLLCWLVVFYLSLHTVGYARLWLPFLPLVCILIAIGAVDIAGLVQRQCGPAAIALGRRLALALPLLILATMAVLELQGQHAAKPDGDSFEPGMALAARLPSLARPGESVLAMQPMATVIAYELQRQDARFQYRSLPRPPAGSGRTVMAMGGPDAKARASSLVVLRNDGHGLDYVLRYFGLPYRTDTVEEVLAFSGGTLVRVGQ